MLKKLDRLAKAFGVSRSVMIERTLREALEDTELSVAALTDPVVSGALVQMMSNRDVLRTLAKAFGEGASEQQLELFASRFGKLAEQAEKKGGKK